MLQNCNIPTKGILKIELFLKEVRNEGYDKKPKKGLSEDESGEVVGDVKLGRKQGFFFDMPVVWLGCHGVLQTLCSTTAT